MAEKPKKNRLLVSFCKTKTGNMHRLPITHFEHMQQIKQKKLKNYKVVINDNWHELTKYSVMVYLNHTKVLLAATTVTSCKLYLQSKVENCSSIHHKCPTHKNQVLCNTVSLKKQTQFCSQCNTVSLKKQTRFCCQCNTVSLKKQTRFCCQCNTVCLKKQTRFCCQCNTVSLKKQTQFCCRSPKS